MTVRFSIDQNDIAEASSLFAKIAGLSSDAVGVSRPAFSDVETRTLTWLQTQARIAGLAAWFDAGQNLIMALPEDAKAPQYVLVGSHVDSVPMGGNYDGLAGVLAGFLCLKRTLSAGQRFDRPVRVIALRGEESAWFGPCYIASKALMGVLGEAELEARHKEDGRTLSAHMADVGIDMAPIRQGEPLMRARDVLAYIELHIEQGPLLTGNDWPVAIVTGIRGNFRHREIVCKGRAGHSGAVPRAFRRDPVMAVADLLTRLDECWSDLVTRGDDLVLTCGILHTDAKQNAVTRIPHEARFSLDFRSQSKEVLERMKRLLSREVAQIEAARRVEFVFDPVNETAPAMMRESLISGLCDAMEQRGLAPVTVASGGGHDAAVFAGAGIPSALVFVRNCNGSHNPKEAMDIEDFLSGVAVINDTLTNGYLKDPDF